MERKNKPIKWPLLILLCLVLLLAVLPFLPGLGNVIIASPFGYLYLFLVGLGYDLWWLAPLLALLALGGWVLLHLGKRPGKWILVAVFSALLIGNLVVFAMHFITTMGSRNLEGLGLTLALALSCLVFSVPILILTSRWYPRISYQ